MKLEGYKKIITTVLGMMSLNYIAYLIFSDTIDGTHKIELYALIVGTLGALAGVHGFIQSKLDKAKIEGNTEVVVEEVKAEAKVEVANIESKK